MDQIFGIMSDHNLEADVVLFFIKPDVLIDPVEAVGLGGGSVMRAYRQMYVAKTLGNRGNGFFS